MGENMANTSPLGMYTVSNPEITASKFFDLKARIYLVMCLNKLKP